MLFRILPKKKWERKIKKQDWSTFIKDRFLVSVFQWFYYSRISCPENERSKNILEKMKKYK